jgi:hypothetical protein
MTTLNLNTITTETFEIIIRNLVGTDCRIEFLNYTKEHEQLAMNVGLAIICSDTLEVFCKETNLNSYY